jgi:glyoxylase-like metal-dependent hydrolase (beta-lactamase superfamily II)
MDATALGRLHASSPTPLPFAPSLVARAFVLERPAGNLMIYSGGDAGGLNASEVTRRYLSHGHEAIFEPSGIDAPLFVHAADRDAVERRVHVRGSFTRRHALDDDLEVIPIPGHTPGATAFLWDSGDARFLFTGDTIYLDGGEWVAAVLDSSDRAAYLDSLALLRDLRFDVLVPWVAGEGDAPHALTDEADARDRIDALIERVRGGASH